MRARPRRPTSSGQKRKTRQNTYVTILHLQRRYRPPRCQRLLGATPILICSLGTGRRRGRIAPATKGWEGHYAQRPLYTTASTSAMAAARACLDTASAMLDGMASTARCDRAGLRLFSRRRAVLTVGGWARRGGGVVSDSASAGVAVRTAAESAAPRSGRAMGGSSSRMACECALEP